ncbi:glycosyl hydrolases family 17 protein [Emydomyces testavorans]|uniref:glucan endo-1,3-beta-D-glucosidase n=1 Tax=Emydomyces testavorans TaxID=2070801 RepID=A0AAF0IGT8_9EURO|nr:glycosyl hydrolases family 17 protein [Emydomyces testavorans]
MPYHPEESYGADPSDNRGWNPLKQQSAYSPKYHYDVPSSLQPSPPPPGGHPASHPDSTYNRLRQERQYGDEYPADIPNYSTPQPFSHGQRPQPTIQTMGRSQTTRTDSTVSPGADNLGPMSAGGGIAGIATGVASTHERQSGVEAIRGNTGPYNNNHPQSEAGYYASPPEHAGMSRVPMSTTPRPYSPNAPLASAIEGNGNYMPTPSDRSLNSNGQLQPHYDGLNGTYSDPYHRQRTSWAPMNEPINPNDIIDDGDDGFIPDPKRKSMLSSLGKSSSHQSLSSGGAAAAGGAAAGGVAGAIAGRVNGQTSGSPDGGPSYSAIPPEKSEWLVEQKASKKKLKWILGILAAILLLGAIAGGVVAGILVSKKNSSGGNGGSGKSADDDTKANGDLGKNSKEIQALMNNPKLHKVFPGIDYTPWGTQYPLCLKYPPSQNNVTRDMAVLSQLTNTVRLYGTDCNQTEMVLHAIDRLELKDMKLWMGVWIDNTNTTTNDRQLEQMYDIVKSAKDKSVFKGVIVGNEVLFRGSQSSATLKTLSDYLKGVKSNLTDLNIDIPVATSDLGDAWTAQLAQLADVVMANVHPFFGGIPVDQAAGWTYDFWTSKDVALTKGTNKKQLISEVGWPSGGGNDCGTTATCPDSKSGAIAGVKEMNKFMDDWVCAALKNGTDYFWFEAFDEPWKVQYNTPGKEWEDKWGLMDPGRNLKPGLKIPDCGGQTAT